MNLLGHYVFFLLILIHNIQKPGVATDSGKNTQEQFINENGPTVFTRFSTPAGFERIPTNPNSFAHYLRSLPLKSHGSSVLLYNGAKKAREKIYCAVVDMKIGKKNLQQCADAIIRLRAEYLYAENQIEKIQYNFTNGEKAEFVKYAEGYRANIDEDKVIWEKRAEKNYTHKTLTSYLEMVFMFAGSYSLSRELEPVTNPQEIKIGDIFIKGGFPGHAVIVVDMVENQRTKEKHFLLAQSYMPAQEIQILINPNNNTPWFEIKPPGKFLTPEWVFMYDELKRFKEE